MIGVMSIQAQDLAEAGTQNPQQPLLPVVVSGGGIELWAALLHLHGLQSWEDQNEVRWSEVVVIHLGGDLRYLNRPHDPRREELWNVLRGGGGVLIATDGELALPELGLQFLAGPVLCDDDLVIHRQRPTCVYLLPQEVRKKLVPRVVPEGGGRVEMPPVTPEDLWQGLHRVCCNVSGYLLADPEVGFWRPLARFPPGSYRPPLARFPDEPFPQKRPGNLPLPSPAVFAVGGQWPRTEGGASPGTVLALADHSVFINQMLLEPQTENWELARRVAVCLRGSSRRWCRLYMSGQRVSHQEALQQLLRPPLPPVPPPPPPSLPDLWALQKKLTELGNQAIQAAQQRDLLNTLLLGSPEHPVQRQKRWQAIMKGITVLSLAGILWLLWRGLRRSRMVEVPPGRKVPPQQGWFWQRFSRTSDPAWSAAMRRVLRDFFQRVGGDDPTRTPLPPIEIAPQVTQAERWRHQLQTLWRYAREPGLHWTLQEWSHWEGVLEELIQAHQNGLWRFAQAEESQA
jgi:hypothetical protein